MKLCYDGVTSGLTEQNTRDIEELVNSCPFAVMATNNKETGARVSALNNLPGQSVNEYYFATNLSSQKVKNIKEDATCEIMITNGMGQIIMGGKVEIRTDTETKKAKWQPWMPAHFKGAEAEDYCILKFTPSTLRGVI